MRICRYQQGDRARWGVVNGAMVRELDGDPAGDFRVGADVGRVSDVALLAPCEPTKVICAGRNYRSLLVEQGRDVPSEPFLFLKSSTSVVGPGAEVRYPRGVGDVAHEGELAVVIGTRASGLTEADARTAILGYTCANDITVRDWQRPSSQWVRAKSSDTHCPLGPWLETELANPDDVRVRTHVSNEVRQDGRTSDLVFGITELLVYISAYMTLLPGDVVLTGTSAGIRPVRIGDVMRVEIEGIGTLTNTVVDWPKEMDGQ